jgi:hypothetical protein
MKQIDNLITYIVLMKKRSPLALYLKTVTRQESEIQDILHPAEANLGYFLA